MLNIKRLRHNSRTCLPDRQAQNTEHRTQTNASDGLGSGLWVPGSEIDRPVALTGRASDSKSEGWGFESLLACHFIKSI